MAIAPPRPAPALPARQFFLNGKALPVERGSGADQPVIGASARRLGAGDWIHVFPEGRVQPAGDVGAFRQVHGGLGEMIPRECLGGVVEGRGVDITCGQKA
jgi:hypothetical protein